MLAGWVLVQRDHRTRLLTVSSTTSTDERREKVLAQVQEGNTFSDALP